jgi:hypothetical protein
LPNYLYGYSRDPSHGRRANIEKKVVEKIFRIFTSERISFEAIATRINSDPDLAQIVKDRPMSKVQVFRILHRPEYCGMEMDTLGGYKASENFDLIVDPNTWIEAQILLSRKSDTHKDAQSRLDYPLSGMIMCAECQQFYYIARDKYYAHNHLGKDNSCENHNTYIPKRAMESFLLERLAAYCTNKAFRNDIFDLLRAEQEEKYSYLPNIAEIKNRIDTHTKLALSLPADQISDADQIGVERLSHFLSKLPDIEIDIVAYCLDIISTSFRMKHNNSLDRLGYIDRLVSKIEVRNGQIIVKMKTGKQFSESIELLQTSVEMLRLKTVPPAPSIEELCIAYNLWEKKKRILTADESDDHGFRQFLYEIKKEHIAADPTQVTKMKLYKATLRNVKKPHERFYLSDIYQWNGQGAYLIDTGSTTNQVTVHPASGQVIAVEAWSDLFINEEMVNTLNPDQKLINYAYFDLQDKKIIFIMNTRSIRAYDFSGFRKGKEYQIMSALGDIELCPTAIFNEE